MKLDEIKNFYGFDFSDLYNTISKILNEYEKDKENSEDDKEAKAKNELKQEQVSKPSAEIKENEKNSSNTETNEGNESSETLRDKLFQKFKQHEAFISPEYISHIVTDILEKFTQTNQPSYELKEYYKNDVSANVKFVGNSKAGEGVLVTIYNLDGSAEYNSLTYKEQVLNELRNNFKLGFKEEYISYVENKLYISLIF